MEKDAKLSVLFVVGLFAYGCLESVAYGSAYGRKLCKASPEVYSCYRVSRGQTWRSAFPDPAERDIVMAVNRTNLPLRRFHTIAVPRQLHSVDLLDLSPLPHQSGHVDLHGGKGFIVISLGQLAFGAYDSSGSLVHWGPISGGSSWCSDIGRPCRSPAGSFKVYREDGIGCYSRTYPVGEGGASMPWCMFFHGGFAMHASTELPGHHASHGCVRMLYHDARWLSKYFVESGTPVRVSRD